MSNAPEDNDVNLYALLGLTLGASDGEIRNAYYRLAKEYHPDRRKEDKKAEEAFRAITRAATILRDPEMRRRYSSGESAGAIFAAKPQAARRSRRGRRVVLAFLVSFIVSTVVATKLWLALLSPASELPNLVRNDPGVTAPKAADASPLPDKTGQDYGPQALSLPSNDSPSLARSDPDNAGANQLPSKDGKAAENHAPPSMPEAAGSTSESGSWASAGEREVPPIGGANTFSHQEQRFVQKTVAIGLPTFHMSQGSSKPASAKLSLLREGKSRPGNCRLSLAARDILLHVSAALRGR
jgi:hypothetical protein